MWIALLPGSASGSMPGENGEILVFGHVDDERGLYLVDLDPLSLEKLPIEVHDLELGTAAWSPTGTILAFTRHNANNTDHGLWAYEMASGETTLLATAPGGVEYTSLSFSPAGDELIVGTHRNVGGTRTAGLARFSGDGVLLEEIDLPSSFVWRAEWSPTRTEILLWLGWRGNSTEPHDRICLLPIDTGDLNCVAEEGWWPTWSPGGKQIAFGRGTNSTLTIVDRQGALIDESAHGIGYMTAWSPDGTSIAYPAYFGEPEVGEFAIELLDLRSNQRHRYVAGIQNVLDLQWRPLRPASGFLDVPDVHVFAADVAWLGSNGFTDGCDPPVRTLFCPERSISRGELAAVLHRALGYEITPVQPATEFVDTATSVFAGDIGWLSATGITKGCNPPANTRFCPDGPVTRGQLAAFLVRALGYTDDGGGNLFIDDDGSTFEHHIDRLGAAGVARGCNPPANTHFCPNEPVTRGQMAAFLHRALGTVN